MIEGNVADLEAKPGSYVLYLRSAHARRIRAGALGLLTLEPGLYAYCGSARGPGGVAARLGRHLRNDRAKPLRWHIDSLRRACPVDHFEVAYGDQVTECDHAARLAADPAWTPVFPGFGASDCRCPTHLFHSGAVSSRRK